MSVVVHDRSNKWTPKQVGFVDFWAYDYEVYPFHNGKIIFRGSNGQGKSVSMQSIIPMLLDGNTHPSRIDPFGTGKRKIIDYLKRKGKLDTGRISYLFITYERLKTKETITTGIGLRPINEIKVDFWGFVVNNVEIGKEFILTRSIGFNRDGEEEFVSLSKDKMKEQIQNLQCGKFVDSRKDYADEVNKALFQFDSYGVQFKELTKLLIQLRSPKLSKEMKPDVLYEALKQSLGELPSNEFAVISNTIKDIEDRNIKIKKTEADLELAASLLEGFQSYQQNMLANTSYRYVEAYKREKALERKLEENKSELVMKLAELEKINDRLSDLEIAISTTKMNLNLLETSEVRSYNDDKQKKEKEKEEKDAELNRNTKKLEEYTSLSNELKENINKYELKCHELGQVIKNLANVLDELSCDIQFTEHSPYQAKALDSLSNYQKDKLYFNTWLSRLEDHIKFLENILSAVEEEKRVEGLLNQKKNEIRAVESEIEAQQKVVLNLERDFNTERDNYRIGFKNWIDGNQEYSITTEKIGELINQLEGLLDSHETRTEVIETELFQLKTQLLSKLDFEINLEKARIHNLQTDIDALIKEKEELESDNDIIPSFRHRKSILQRQTLKENNIPFIPFYEAVDFLPKVTEEQKLKIESALIDMGLLDRLIVPAEYQGMIGKNEGYLFPNPCNEQKTKTLSSALSAVVPEDRSVSAQEIEQVLNSISVDFEGSETYLTLNGEFRHGLVKGYAIHQEQAVFIGKEARKRFRELKIKEIEGRIAQLQNQIGDIRESIIGIGNRKEKLECEYLCRPSLKKIDEILFNSRIVLKGIKGLSEKRDKLGIAHGDLLADYHLKINERKRVSTDLEGPKDVETIKELVRLSKDDYKDGVRDLKQSLTEYEFNKTQYVANKEQFERVEDDILFLKGEVNVTSSRIKELEKEIEIIKALLKEKGAEEVEGKINKLRSDLGKLEREQREKWQSQPTLTSDIENIKEKIEEVQADHKFLVNLLSAREEILAIEIRSNEKTLFQNKLYDFALKHSKEVNVSDAIREFYTRISSINSMGLEDYSLTSRDSVVGKSQINGDDYPTKKEHLEILSSERKRLTVTLFVQGAKMNPFEFHTYLKNLKDQQASFLKKSEEDLIKNVMIQGLGEKIRDLILKAKTWRDDINSFMKSMNNSIELRLLWEPIDKTDGVDSLTTSKLVELLGRDFSTLKESDIEAMSKHFMTKINIAKDHLDRKNDNDEVENLEQALKQVLDYRDWYKFKIKYTLEGDVEKTLDETNLSILSGGEKAMAIYIPLFSAAYSKYSSASPDAPYMIALDEAFAGVDEDNISEMFALMEQLGFDYILTSQALWADYPSVSGISIYDLTFDKTNFFVFSEPWIWNGQQRVMNMDVLAAKGMYLNEDGKIEGEAFQDDLFSFSEI